MAPAGWWQPPRRRAPRRRPVHRAHRGRRVEAVLVALAVAALLGVGLAIALTAPYR